MDSLMSMSSCVMSSNCAAISADTRPVCEAELVLARPLVSLDCEVRAGNRILKHFTSIVENMTHLDHCWTTVHLFSWQWQPTVTYDCPELPCCQCCPGSHSAWVLGIPRPWSHTLAPRTHCMGTRHSWPWRTCWTTAWTRNCPGTFPWPVCPLGWSCPHWRI